MAGLNGNSSARPMNFRLCESRAVCSISPVHQFVFKSSRLVKMLMSFEKYFEVEVRNTGKLLCFDKLSILKSKHKASRHSKYYREYCRSFLFAYGRIVLSEEHQQGVLNFLKKFF